MKRVAYFPGCALKDQARSYEAGSKKALEVLGYELVELSRWNCCGTVYALAQDDLVRHLGPLRNLVRTQEMGLDQLVTLCAMCYGTLRRSQRFVEEDEEGLSRISAFMDEEQEYAGGVKVLHLLTLLRDEVGFELLESKVTRPLEGLKVGAYYGCMLLRPRDVGVDDPDRPEVMERVLGALGATPVFFPERTECCGTYLTVARPDVVQARSERILASAKASGADVVVTSCPLCQFNLENRRPAWAAGLPVVYLGEVLAWALVQGATVPEEIEAKIGKPAEVKA